MKHNIKSIIVFLTILAITITLFPVAQVSATPTKKYLVLVGQYDGTFKAYDDLAVSIEGNIMVKLKPFADVMNMTYQSVNGSKKGCVLSSGNGKNVYTRNSKTYYYKLIGTNSKLLAEYKQTVYDSYNVVHYETISTLRNCSYFSTSDAPYYKLLGYSGVIVYNNSGLCSNLPDLSSVYNTAGYILMNTKVTVDVEEIKSHLLGTKIRFSNNALLVSAIFKTVYSPNKFDLDLIETLRAFKKARLPFDGIYGYGNCDNTVTIQGIDKKGSVVGEIKTNGKGFLLDFPKATKLRISGTVHNLIINFTPIKPILITKTTKVPTKDINWLSPDGYALQYFVLSKNIQFNAVKIDSAFCQRYQPLDMNMHDESSKSTYQSLMLLFSASPNEIINEKWFLEFKMMQKLIDDSLVTILDGDKTLWASNYESELTKMISAIKEVGTGTYFLAENFKNKLVVKILDVIPHTAKDYIALYPVCMDLKEPSDYETHLHEMTHFYESKPYHYGFCISSWCEGNSTTLSEKAMVYLNISDYDWFQSYYGQEINFLTKDNKINFEDYYLNLTGDNAYIVGYQFTTFLQKTYGEDIVFHILEKVNDANIPAFEGKNSAYDKQFADCIKAATSQDVFQLFVETCIKD